ncbi:hypothetical protein FBU30_000222 [Linnemannia zychae]|nr:hypothetical protein FBU30_000222 [Linnemannia zychae]
MAVSSASRSVSQASRFFRSLPTSLEEISIHDSYTLSHSDIITLIDQVGPGLKVLRFDHANAINSETLSHVLAVCTNLTVLSIPRASRLDDAGVIQLIGAKCAGSLVELDLSACHSLSDGCLTALAKSIPATPSRPLVLHENDKGKAIQEPNDPCLFPNLRRLDLSYNCKMTLSGIIPLVMSLKNLCALDVSFCGDGVTRSWSSNLESLRHSLSPSSSSVVDSAGIDDLFGETVIESDHSEDEEPSTGSQHQYRQYHQNSLYQEQQQQVHPRTGSTTTSSSPSQQYGLSSQNLQRFANNVAPLMNTSRIGLGRYVGPILDHNTGTNFTNNLNNISYNNSISPQHPQQLTGLGDNIIDQFSPGDRRRSSASSMASSSSMSSISSGSSSNLISDSSSASYSGSRSNSTYTHNRRRSSCSRILLADRLDVLENTPRRVGIPASFYLESWFTPQHQLQLQHLLQIQVQHQRDLQEVQAQAAMAQATATALNGAFQHQQQFGAAIGAFANMMPFAALSAEMMNHPVMSAIRVGTATVGSNNNGGGGGGYGIGHGGAGNGGNLFSQQPFESHNNSDANIYHHTNRRMGLGNDVGGTTRTGIRHHHRHHYQHPHYHRCNSSPNAIFGHCEISAWGLSKLREEWATVM